MYVIAVLLVSVLGLLVIAQAIPVVQFIRLARCWEPPSLPHDECPLATIVLALRGDDPFLKDSIHGLLNQDYPRYQVRIIVDSCEDPAWAVAHNILGDQCPDNVTLECLQHRLSTCGMKHSGLVQVIEFLDEDCEVVAFLDADAVPHASWLRELVAPIVKDGASATTGQRWFMPTDVNVASLVRHIWNSGTVAGMATRSIWGGCYALRTEIIRKIDLVATRTSLLCGLPIQCFLLTLYSEV